GPAGLVLLGAAVLGFVATSAVVSNRHRAVTLTFSALASVATIAAGPVVAMLAAVTGALDVAEAGAGGPGSPGAGRVRLRVTRRPRRRAEQSFPESSLCGGLVVAADRAKFIRALDTIDRPRTVQRPIGSRIPCRQRHQPPKHSRRSTPHAAYDSPTESGRR